MSGDVLFLAIAVSVWCGGLFVVGWLGERLGGRGWWDR